jgi:RNA polymerase sigma factor (TIGR02999 family)
MTASPSHEITEWLAAWNEGDQQALDQLIPLVYEEMRRIAHRYLRREQAGHSLQTTALAHEAFLKLTEGAAVTWQDRTHFFAVCANVMRRLLVDLARERQSQKQGGGALHVDLEEALSLTEERDGSLLALNDALDALAQQDARKSRVIELRYFVGLSVEETAEVLKVSPDTIMRDWRLAKAWLLQQLSNADGRT